MTGSRRPEPGTPPVDAETLEPEATQAVEEDLVELVARRDEYLALAQRTKADFENFRKRMSRDVAVAESRGAAKLAKELLPALDNLERALEHAAQTPARQDGVDDHLAAGVKLVHADLLGALQRVGIESFSPAGEAFDPAHHEAIAHAPVEGVEPGTVAEVYQSGYRLGEVVLRPARVVVAQ